MVGPTSSHLPRHHVSVSHRPLRRLTVELFGIIALKVVALTLIWWIVIAPHPKPDTSPAAIAQRLAPTSPTTAEPRP